jgi:glycosyltransferase involved in cell wall biosynthesis
MIGISMLTLNQQAAGGTLTYARELLRALARVGEHEYRVFVPSTAPEAANGLPATIVRAFPARTRLGRVTGLALATLAPQLLRRAWQRSELDAIHFPLTAMLPPAGEIPAAVTVHDLQHEAFPRFFSRSQLTYRRRVYGRSVRQSGIVIADSDYVRSELVERYGLEPARVRTIHLAVDHRRFTPDGSSRLPFLLYPANLWPHKNHARLFQAFELVRRERPELRLVLTGADHGGHLLPTGVESRGHVPVAELVRLYRSAAALVYPSLYEGFGIPCLEAMACGCPVTAARVASLPEVCGDAAVYFDPESVEDLARAIDRVLTSPPAGVIEQAARFTWEECARRHEAVYRELVDSVSVVRT